MLPGSRVSRIEEIPEWRKGRPRAVMILAYCDESADGRQEKVFAVAGLIGTEEEWFSTEKKWTQRTEGREFHATDCEANRGDFKHNSPEENRLLYKDLTNILALSPLWGFGCALDIKAYKDVMPISTKDVPPYFTCFQETISNLAFLGSKYVPQQKIEYIFHTRCDTDENALHYYMYLKKSGHIEELSNVMSDKISTATSATVGIQVADLFSHEVMKDFEWLLDRKARTIARRRRLSWEALSSTGRVRYAYLFRKELEFIAKATLDTDHKNGDQWEDYQKWRAKKGCNDNMQERIRFLLRGDPKKR